jgi:hypothetical protein
MNAVLGQNNAVGVSPWAVSFAFDDRDWHVAKIGRGLA